MPEFRIVVTVTEKDQRTAFRFVDDAIADRLEKHEDLVPDGTLTISYV
jgi:hypothetical protein